MSSERQIYNFNDAYALLQQNILEQFKAHNPALASITCENNKIIYNEESFELGYFRLSQLPAITWTLSAKDFYEIVKLITEIENNVINEEYYIFNINELLEKSNLTAEETQELDNFVSTYLVLAEYENFLTSNANTTLSKYRQIVNNILYLLEPNSLTEGQKLITERILNKQEEINGRGKSMLRVLTNPDAPSTFSEEEVPYSKAGFASIILIVYSIINAAIILAIHLIK